MPHHARWPIGFAIAAALMANAAAQETSALPAGSAAAQDAAAEETAVESASTGEGGPVKGVDAARSAAAPTSTSARAIARIAPGATAAEDGNWRMPAKDYASTRFSALDGIHNGNVDRLTEVFAFDTGIDRGQEAAPIVVGDTMYVVTPFPNVLYALDLRRPDAPLKWKYEPHPEPASQGIACCDVVNRGAVFWQDRLIYNTLDGHTVAVEAATGKELWKTRLGNIHVGETITMAPLVVKGKVLVGNSGGELGVRGWLAALDASDGRVVWKAFNTGPDRDVLIGAGYAPFYASERGKDLGVKSWPPEAWTNGGGTSWGWISYDPKLDLIYYGTGNPGPWNAEQRPGDNKWTSGLFARDPDTGAARWFYQVTPHDAHDYDAINESILLDMPVGGRLREVLVRSERNGFFYVIDRATGEVLSADPYAPVNSVERVDLQTGRPIYNVQKLPKEGRVVRNICPSANGSKDWNPTSFSPRTGLVYIPHTNLCMDMLGMEVNYIAGTPYVGAEVRMFTGPGGHRGELIAWDPVARRKVWGVVEDLPVWSGTLVTAGDLVFYGTMDGWFKALDARTGEQRWSFKAGSGIIGQPVSYRGPDARQYIAVLAGVGGWAGAIVVNNLDPRDDTAALGMVHATADLKLRTKPGGTLHVFAVPAE